MKHGARHTYDDQGCRCLECQAAKREHGRSRYVASRGLLSSGWQRSPGDVDEIAVERACRGVRGTRLTGAEMYAAFCWMDDHGRTAPAIAKLLGISVRTVQRWRAKRREKGSEKGCEAA